MHFHYDSVMLNSAWFIGLVNLPENLAGTTTVNVPLSIKNNVSICGPSSGVYGALFLPRPSNIFLISYITLLENTNFSRQRGSRH